MWEGEAPAEPFRGFEEKNVSPLYLSIVSGLDDPPCQGENLHRLRISPPYEVQGRTLWRKRAENPLYSIYPSSQGSTIPLPKGENQRCCGSPLLAKVSDSRFTGEGLGEVNRTVRP